MSAESRCCALPMQPRHHDHDHHHHHHHGYHPHDEHAATESTSKLTSAPSAYSARSAAGFCPDDDDAASRSKRRRRRAPGRGLGLLFAGLPGLFRRRRGRRASPSSEARLRRRVRRHAERGDWESVRRLLSGYEFSDLPPEEVVSRQQQQQLQQGQGFVPENTPLQEELQEEARRTVTSRRPSYGSRTGGERRSFTGKESAAAAAAIRDALLEESDRSSSSPSDRQQSSDRRCCAVVDYGENILHDVMRRRPPLDVAEALLGALRHRGGTTVGTDGQGRTPLHVAASYGADPAVIDALIRADPCPASAGDADGRSPLHLAVRLLARGGYDSPQEQHHHRRGGKGRRVKGRGKGKDNNASAIDEEGPALGPREAEVRTYRTVLLLKAAMLAYPGKIGFKDEDVDGYSPLDYAIDDRDRGRSGGIDGDASSSSVGPYDLVRALVRRKEPVRSSPRGGSVSSRHLSLTRRLPQNVVDRGRRRRTSLSADDQDMEVLRQLERDEIDARRQRIERIRARMEREVMHDALFDVFGIEEEVEHHHCHHQPPSPPTATVTATAGVEGGDDDEEEEEEETSAAGPKGSLPEQERSRDSTTAEEHRQRAATEEDIYDRHLQDYLEDCMDDFGDCEGLGLEYCDYAEDDDFDILEDPSLAREDDCPQAPAEAKVPLPFFLAFSCNDDDCASVVSEITVSLAR